MSSKMSKVYFGSVQHGQATAFASFATKVDKVIEKLDLSTIKQNEKVAIKMHLGFSDGYQTIPVFFVRRIVKAVKTAGGWPFITDNPTSVYNAVNRGYTQETCGCPIIPVAGVKEGYTYPVTIDYLNIDTLDVGGALHDADVLIDLTHAKGHGCCGYGGAIKNLALGGYSASSRWHKIHRIVDYHAYWEPERCSPEHALRLVDSCQYNALSYDQDEHKLTLDLHNCTQCLACKSVDTNVNCLHIQQANFNAFQELMAIGAKKVLDMFDDEKKFFVNFLMDITAYCDCVGIAQPRVVNDIGVLGSRDIVAIETATLDLIAQEGLIEPNIPLYFHFSDRQPSTALHPFQRLHGPMKNPYFVVQCAETLGVGSQQYELVEVLSPEETAKMDAPVASYERAPSFM